MKVCFLHGLDSSPTGTKATLLRKHVNGCWIPELPPGSAERIRLLEQEVCEPMLFVGSSLGGLTAILYAMRHPEKVLGLVLLAPAVGTLIPDLFTEEEKAMMASTVILPGIPATVIAGMRDEVVPLTAIQAFVDRSPDPERIRLAEVDDDHDLHHSLDRMLEAIEQIREEIPATFLRRQESRQKKQDSESRPL
jgi:pimeloyl-ACP methyl ester carboxylesterase